jgi:hypothetical protein
LTSAEYNSLQMKTSTLNGEKRDSIFIQLYAVMCQMVSGR